MYYLNTLTNEISICSSCILRAQSHQLDQNISIFCFEKSFPKTAIPEKIQKQLFFGSILETTFKSKIVFENCLYLY